MIRDVKYMWALACRCEYTVAYQEQKILDIIEQKIIANRNCRSYKALMYRNLDLPQRLKVRFEDLGFKCEFEDSCGLLFLIINWDLSNEEKV